MKLSVVKKHTTSSALDATDLLPPCAIQFWKPILQLCLDDGTLLSLILDQIFTFLTDYYRLSASEPSILDRQRIGWIFYFIEQPTVQLDLRSIFIRLVRVLQPWFAEPLSQLVVRMAEKSVISEEKRETLLRTISMFADPFKLTNAEEESSLDILPRNELYTRERAMFRQRTSAVNVPAGFLNEEDDQNLELNLDLSKTDRNCKWKRKEMEVASLLPSVLGCVPKPKTTDQAPTKRKRSSSGRCLKQCERIHLFCLASIDPTLFHDLLWRQAHYR